jgi:hypothetical protein
MYVTDMNDINNFSKVYSLLIEDPNNRNTLSAQIVIDSQLSLIPVNIKQSPVVNKSSLVLTSNSVLSTIKFLNIVNNFQGNFDLGLKNNTLLNYSKNKPNINKLNSILRTKYNSIYSLDLSNNKLVYNDMLYIFNKFNSFPSTGGLKFSTRFESLNLSNNPNLITDMNLPSRLSNIFTPSTNKITINISNSFSSKVRLSDLLKKFVSGKYNLITKEVSAFTNTTSFIYGKYMYVVYILLFLLALYILFNCI